MTSAASTAGPEASFWASNVLRNLKLSLEAKGMQFFVDPPRNVIPPFLGDYKPDAIALGRDGGIVFEVKRGPNMGANRRVADISERVSREKGWEFRAIYLTPPADRLPDIPVPTWQQLQRALGEVEALATGGHQGAALLAGWSALEAMAHLARANSGSAAPKPLSPLQAVQALAEEGYVEANVATRLRGFATTRNAVAHGNLSVEVTQEQAESLLQDLRSIFTAIEEVEHTPAGG